MILLDYPIFVPFVASNSLIHYHKTFWVNKEINIFINFHDKEIDSFSKIEFIAEKCCEF